MGRYRLFLAFGRKINKLKEYFMKTVFNTLGILALAAIIGLGMLACNNDTTPTSDSPLTGTVSISGTPELGETLTADTSELDGSETITYQWKRGTTTIGTNSGSYTVVAADLGSTITVTVTRAGYTGSITSIPTAVVTDPSLPSLEGTVSIEGTAIVGQTLTANIDDLDGEGDPSYQWRRDDEDGTVVGSDSSYEVVTDDVGFTLTVTVTTSGNSGNKSDTSGIVAAFPALTGSVSIEGAAELGETLIANTDELGGEGEISYQWKRNGTIDIGSDSDSYDIVEDDVSSSITVTVTRDGYAGSVTSIPTDVITDPGLPPLDGTVSITGSAIVGQMLTVSTDDLYGEGDPFYQWRRNDDNGTIVGSSSNYVLVAADEGFTLTVTVTTTGNSGSKSDTSGIVALPDLTGSVSITGSAIVGETLTANPSGMGSIGISYQWQRDDEEETVVGSGSTYVVAAADAGYAITVTVARAGYAGSIASEATATVNFPALTGSVSIDGIAEYDEELEANVSALGGTGGISYLWQRNDEEETVIGSAKKYQIALEDVDYTLTVTVTREGYAGSKSSTTDVVIDPRLPDLTGTVSITGTAKVGETLTVDVSGLGGEEGEISYTWKRSNGDVVGTNSSYTLVLADFGYAITVTVTREGYNGSASDQTASVNAYHKVKFVDEDGEELSEQTIARNGCATNPGNLGPKPFAEAPEAGLYAYAPNAIPDKTFAGWYNGATLFSFSTQITADITLGPQWTAPRISTVAVNDLAAAITRVKQSGASYDGAYTLCISTNVNAAPQTLNVANRQLTIIGVGEEREIRLSSNGALFTVGASGQNNIELTLGKNITLFGRKVGGNGGADNNNAVVHVQYNSAKLTMLDGSKITGNNSSTSGGGVRTEYTGSFIMQGGEISGNKSVGSGGGVYAFNAGPVTIHDGIISGNEAAYSAGGIFFYSNSSEFNMYDGKISGNTAGTNGGGVHIEGPFHMYGGEISGNVAANDGGGVRINNNAFHMHDGKISGNEAANGGGVNGNMLMYGGEISGNEAANGGGMYNSGYIHMYDGEISGNVATNDGGGVFLDGGSLSLITGIIYGKDEGGKSNTVTTGTGAALYIDGGTAQYGTYDESWNWTKTEDEVLDGVLDTADYTIEVDEGELIQPVE